LEKQRTLSMEQTSPLPEFCSVPTGHEEHDMKTRPSCKESTGYIKNLQRKVGLLVDDYRFEMVLSAVVVVNSLLVGWRQDLRIRGSSTRVFDTLEQVFLLVYSVELALRIFAGGTKSLQDNWVRFDCAMVLTGILSSPLAASLFERRFFPILVVMRTARVFRLVRTARLMTNVRTMFLLSRGLMTSASVMVYTALLLLILTYIFSCVGVEILTLNTARQSNSAFNAVVNQYFNSVETTMLTLLQFVCMDSIGAIYKPLIEVEPFLALYFVLIIVVIPITAMNLVTAVIVNSALEQVDKDKEVSIAQQQKRKRKLMKELKDIFLRLDEDKSGYITKEEIENISSKDRKVLEACTDMQGSLEIFRALDVDDSDSIDIEEFLEGIWKVSISQWPPEFQRMMKQVELVHANVKQLMKKQQDLERETAEHHNLLCQALISTCTPSSDGQKDPNVQETLITAAIPEDTPAWARLIIDELQSLREDSSDRAAQIASAARRVEQSFAPSRSKTSISLAKDTQFHSHIFDEVPEETGASLHIGASLSHAGQACKNLATSMMRRSAAPDLPKDRQACGLRPLNLDPRARERVPNSHEELPHSDGTDDGAAISMPHSSMPRYLTHLNRSPEIDWG